MDAEALAKKVSERLGTYERISHSGSVHRNSEQLNMRWRKPGPIM